MTRPTPRHAAHLNSATTDTSPAQSAGRQSAPTSASTRARISSAALLVNVTASTWCGSA